MSVASHDFFNRTGPREQQHPEIPAMDAALIKGTGKNIPAFFFLSGKLNPYGGTRSPIWRRTEWLRETISAGIHKIASILVAVIPGPAISPACKRPQPRTRQWHRASGPGKPSGKQYKDLSANIPGATRDQMDEFLC